MPDYKYPYIKGGKAMVAATLGACRYISSTGYFNKAISYYADKYNVSEEELTKNVRARQAAGQKQSNEKKPRKYKWFAVEYSMGNERNGGAYFEPLYAQYEVAKGISPKTVKNRLSAHDDYMSEYAPCHWFGRIQECESEEEAQTTIKQWKEARQ